MTTTGAVVVRKHGSGHWYCTRVRVLLRGRHRRETGQWVPVYRGPIFTRACCVVRLLLMRESIIPMCKTRRGDVGQGDRARDGRVLADVRGDGGGVVCIEVHAVVPHTGLRVVVVVLRARLRGLHSICCCGW